MAYHYDERAMQLADKLLTRLLGEVDSEKLSAPMVAEIRKTLVELFHVPELFAVEARRRAARETAPAVGGKAPIPFPTGKIG